MDSEVSEAAETRFLAAGLSRCEAEGKEGIAAENLRPRMSTSEMVARIRGGS